MVISKLTLTKDTLRKTGHRVGTALSITAVLFGLVSMVTPTKASAQALAGGITQDMMAAATYTWVNESNITLTVNGTALNFYDQDGIQNHTTQREDYFRYINKDTCSPSTIWANSKNPGKVQKVDLHYKSTSNGKCTTYDNHTKAPPNAGLLSPEKADIVYNINNSTISRIDGGTVYTFHQDASNPTLYAMSGKGSQKSCYDTIVVSPGSDHAILWELTDNHGDRIADAPGGINANGCYISRYTDDMNGPSLSHSGDLPNANIRCPNGPYCSDYQANGDHSFTIHLNGPAPTASTNGGNGGSGTGTNCGSGPGTQDAQGNCQPPDDTLNCNSGTLNWIICPVITLGAKAANTVDGFIMNTLDIDVQPIFDRTNVQDSASQGYYKAWNSFRVLAIAILVIAGLVMVASQAIGLELLDAYTIRKVLPRLLVATIGISLSWPLMRLAVDFFDTVGVDLRQLIYAPFSTFHSTISVGAGFLTTAGTLTLLFAMGAPALTFIITAILGVAVGYLILVLRQVALVLLIIVAPVAIACYILPGTQKAWKMWWENFMGLLLMFPIISGLIAAGHVFSAVALKGDGINNSGSLAATIFAIIAYFLPYFLLPMAARMATGAIGTLAGMVNDRSKGIFDRLSKARSNALAYRHHQRAIGQKNVLGSERLGRVYQRTTAIGTPDSGALGLTAAQRARYRGHEMRARDQHIAEALKNDNGRAANDDTATTLASQDGMTARRFVRDYAAQAVAKGFTAAEADRKARDALAQIEGGFGSKIGTELMMGTAWKARAASVTGYEDSDVGKAELFEDARRMVRHGLMTEADAMMAIKANKPRVDQSAISFGKGLDAIGGTEALTTVNANGKRVITAQGQQRVNTLMDSALAGLTPGSLVGARRESMESLAPHLLRQINDRASAVAAAGGDPLQDQQLKRLVGRVAGIQDNINAQSPEMRDVLADKLLTQNIGTTGLRVRDFSDQLRAQQDADFNDVRKEWLGAKIPEEIAAGTQPQPPVPGGGPAGPPGA